LLDISVVVAIRRENRRQYQQPHNRHGSVNSANGRSK
jgi:hypothetical protein